MESLTIICFTTWTKSTCRYVQYKRLSWLIRFFSLFSTETITWGLETWWYWEASNECLMQIPVHESNMPRRIWDTESKNLFLIMAFYHLNGSVGALRQTNIQLIHFYRRIKTRSNKKRRIWIIQASPYSPPSAKERFCRNSLNYWNNYIYKIS